MRSRRPAWTAIAVGVAVCLSLATRPAAAQPSETADPAGSAETDPSSSEVYCTPDDPGLLELSGMTVVDGTIYAVGDSGADFQIAQLDSECRVAQWLPNPVAPFDVEDMTARNGRLWLADVGDNDGVRDTIAMTDLSLSDGTGTVHRLTYPDGPRDAEAVLLESDGRPVVVTKNAEGRSEIFVADTGVEELPSPGPSSLRKVGELVLSSTGTEGGPPLLDGSLLVTGAAMNAAGTVAAVRTYTDLYLWSVGDSGVADALAQPPQVTLPLPAQPQGEAIAFLDNGDLLVASEGGLREATQPIAVLRGVADMVSAPGDVAQDSTGSGDPSRALVLALSATVVLLGIAVLLGRYRRRQLVEDDGPESTAEQVGFDPDDPYALTLEDPADDVDEEPEETKPSRRSRGRS